MGKQVDKVKISKFIAHVLRHEPQIIDLEVKKDGAWARTDKLIKGISDHFNIKFTMQMLEEIVRDDAKNRYSFNDKKTMIRANQGHSIDVNPDLVESEPPEFLLHGTSYGVTKSIAKSGLLPMKRQYVHLSKDVDTATAVGERHRSQVAPVIYRVNTKQMYEDGYKFFISENGVWLTKEVPPKYLEMYYPEV